MDIFALHFSTFKNCVQCFFQFHQNRISLHFYSRENRGLLKIPNMDHQHVIHHIFFWIGAFDDQIHLRVRGTMIGMIALNHRCTWEFFFVVHTTFRIGVMQWLNNCKEMINKCVCNLYIFILNM